MKSLKKVAALMLAASFLVSMAACNKTGKNKSRSGEVITDKTPWYEATVFNVDFGLDKNKEPQNTYNQFVGIDDKYIVLFTDGNYKMPKSGVDNPDEYSKYRISNITVVDRATKETVNTIDLSKVFASSSYVERVKYNNDKLTVTASDYKDMNYIKQEMELDISTGKILSTRELEDDASPQQSFTVGKYNLDLYAIWGENNAQYYANVTTPEGETKKVDIKADNLQYVDNIIPVGDTTALIFAYTDNSVEYFELDLTTLNVTKADKSKYEWMELNSYWRMFGAADGNIYSLETSGIYKLDMKKQTSESVLDFSWCSLGRSNLMDLQVYDVTDGVFTLCGSIFRPQPYTQNYVSNSEDFMLVEIKKADKNPHAGKKILEVYSSDGYLDERLSNALKEFNNTNKDYYLEVTDRYTLNSSDSYKNINNSDDSTNVSLKLTSELSNNLAMDLMNGDGPDILLNVNYLSQLNNNNYLLDLQPYFGNLDKDKYFTNVVDAFKTDGKLFNMPICFSVSGIQTDAKNASSTGKGFTPDEYAKFLKENLNGTDIITSGQPYYFTTLFDNMIDKFIVNGKADFTGPEFAALADFVKDNVQEKAPDWNEMDGMTETIVYENGKPVSSQEKIKPAVYGYFYSYYDYCRAMEETNGATDILGIPSSDGRGPVLNAVYSVAVSAQSTNAEACVEFIKMLMSDDMQKSFSEQFFSINRNAFKSSGAEAIKVFNSICVTEPYYEVDDPMAPKNKIKYTNEHLEKLEKIITDCTSAQYSDPAISIILIEEMPGYFSGQKKLEDVIKVAQDRVQKVIDERK